MSIASGLWRACLAVVAQALFALFVHGFVHGVARAQHEPLLSEPIGYTDVADAFDGDDPLDVNVRIGFRSEFRSALIEREVVDEASADGRVATRYQDVLDHSRTRNELRLGLEVGVYHDVMVFLGVPLVLSDDEELRPANGESCGAGTAGPCRFLVEPTLMGGTASILPLMRSLASKPRSGLPEVELGAAWAVTNQYRGADATWALRITFGIATGEVKSACVAAANSNCSPGISDGTSWVKLESRWSRRYRYLEPLLGLSHRFGWVANGSALFTETAAEEAGELPTTTDAVVGAAVIPWEDRMRHQRFSIELMGRAAYVSSGRGLSPLFDALGTSLSHHLASADDATRGTPFTGVTTIGAHGELGFDASLVMKAARYVTFMLGTGIAAETAHLITGAEDCDAGDPRASNTSQASGCRDTYVSSLYRPVIDAPGQRFRVSEALNVALTARAIGQF
jgi:hypothetical protein